MTFETRTLEKYRDKLEAARLKLCEDVLAFPSPDFGGYSRKVGQHQGIKDALAILQEVEKELGR